MTEHIKHHSNADDVVNWIKTHFEVQGVIQLHPFESQCLFEAMYHGEKIKPLQMTREEMLSLVAEFRKIEIENPPEGEPWYEVDGNRVTELGC